MSSILTKWVVLQHHDVVDADLDAAGIVRADVVTGCTVHGDVGVVPSGAEFAGATAVSVSAAATEFWPDAFSLAIRMRGFGVADEMSCNLARRVSRRRSFRRGRRTACASPRATCSRSRPRPAR